MSSDLLVMCAQQNNHRARVDLKYTGHSSLELNTNALVAAFIHWNTPKRGESTEYRAHMYVARPDEVGVRPTD